jgi:hypothetical protein
VPNKNELPLIGGGYIDTPYDTAPHKYQTTFGDVIASAAGTGQTEVALTGPNASLPGNRFLVDVTPGFGSAIAKLSSGLSALGSGTYGRSFFVEWRVDGVLTDVPFSFKIWLRPES